MHPHHADQGMSTSSWLVTEGHDGLGGPWSAQPDVTSHMQHGMDAWGKDQPHTPPPRDSTLIQAHLEVRLCPLSEQPRVGDRGQNSLLSRDNQ